MTDRTHPALRGRRTCDHDGGRGIGAGHVCTCRRDAGHAEPWHGCVCGATWTATRSDDLEATGVELEDAAAVIELFPGCTDPGDSELIANLELSIARAYARRVRNAATEERATELVLELMQRLGTTAAPDAAER